MAAEGGPARAAEPAATPNLAVITNFSGLHSFPDAELGVEHPLRIEAVVNCYDPQWHVFWLQDEGGGYYLDDEQRVLPVKSGQRIVILTTTRAGTRLPSMGKARFEVLAENAFPPPRLLPSDPTGWSGEGSLWSQAEGFGRRVLLAPDRVQMELVVGGAALRVFLFHPTNAALPELEEAYLRLRGVFALSKGGGGQPEQHTLWVPRPEDVEVLEPNLNSSFAGPILAIHDLYSAPTNAPARIQGNLRSQTPGKSLVIEDDTGLASVESWQVRFLPAGSAVEAVGFPVAEGLDIRIRDGFYRPLASRAQSDPGPAPAPEQTTLRRVDRVRGLSRDEAAKAYPVRISGVVTFSLSEPPNLFVQDSTAGIFVDAPPPSPVLQPGDWVEIEGVSGPGLFAPVVQCSNLIRLGTARLPEPQPVTFERLWSGAGDSQFVEFEGWVRSVTNASTLTHLNVSGPGGELTVRVPLSEGLAALRGAVIRVHGVGLTVINERGQMTGVELLVPSTDSIEVLEPAPPDAFALPLRRLASLREFNAATAVFRRTRVQGTVTYQTPKLLFLQDGDDAVLALVRGGAHLQPGDQVEVVGFPVRERRRLVIQDAIFRRTGAGREPDAPTVAESRSVSEEWEARLVQTEGQLLDQVRHGRELQLTLQSGPVIFTALWEGADVPIQLKSIPRGARLSLRGVYRLQEDESGVPRSFRLYLRSAGDVRILKRPSWWTPGRTLMAVGLLGAALLIGLGWVVLLRRRVQQQTDIIRKQLEHEALIEARYRELVEQASEIIFTVDLEGRLAALNQAALRLFGYDHEEALSLNLTDLAAEPHRPRVELLLQQYRSGHTPASLELDVLHKDGRRAILEINTRLAREGGHPGLLQCIAREVTERRQAEENLRLSEARLAEERTLLRTLIDNLPDYIYIKDLQGRYLLSNRAHVRLLGGQEGVIGKTVFDLFPPETARLYEEGDRRVIESGNALLDQEEPSLREGDAQRWLSTTKVPMRDGQGRIVGVIGISRDITVRKQAEEQLRKLSRAVEQSPVCIVITDRAGRIEYVNPRFSAVTGYTLGEVSGRNPRVLKSGRMPAEGYSRLWGTILAGQQWQGELQNRKKSGELYWVAAAISPIRNEKGEVSHFLSIQEDITERRNLEQQLRHAQKMESVGQLAAGVAHDFNNIMTVIQGHASLLLADPELKAEAAESLGQIETSVQRAADVTRQLLTFSRKQIMQPGWLDLNTVVQGLARSLGRLLGETVLLDFDYKPQLPAVRGDVGMVEQIVMNLAVNARDAMPQGGRLRISTDTAQVEAADTGFTPEARPGHYVCLSVEDTGCGMDDATLQRIFEPFFTTKDVGKGTGLGLATVYGIVKQHEGFIQVRSEVGRGATFQVFFPAHSVPARRPDEKPAPAAPPRGGQETLLVVEDEPPLRKLVQGVLERQGYRALSAATGAEALRVWEQESGRIDLLLTDLVMPEGISGRELAERLGRQHPRLKVIFTSGYSADFTSTGMHLQDGVNFLQKPYPPARLVELVRRRLDGPSEA